MLLDPLKRVLKVAKGRVLAHKDEPGLEEVLGVVEALLGAAFLVDLERLSGRSESSILIVRRVMSGGEEDGSRGTNVSKSAKP